MNLTVEQKRAIASLRTVAGYQLVIDLVVKTERAAALSRLKSAKYHDDIVRAAMEFCTWDRVVEVLENYPAQMVEVLKQEGDQIYG